MNNNEEQITYFADTDARNRRVRFGIKAKDRTRHVYVIGKTGMGKSTLLENMAVQDIRNGNGFAFLDPHGKTADLLLEYIPKERMKDVVYFAPFDMEHPVSFNVMEDVGHDKRHLVVSGLMGTFKKIWKDAWSARMEYILANTLLALLEYPDSTLLDVNKMLADKPFRKKVVDNLTDISVKSFWVDEFAKYTDRMAAEATPAIQNKIGQFAANPLIRNIIGQPKSSFDIREAMDDKKILIINLSKGRIGESNANLLGSMLITKIYLAALSRADLGEKDLEAKPNFYLYVDEFQSFANESFADILSEARKYKLNLTIAHQYIEQMSEEVRAAVFGNVGTMITFRVGSFDGEVLEKEFAPTFATQDIVNLGKFQLYLRLMIDGIGSQPFSATSMPPLEKPEISLVNEIIQASRDQFAKPRVDVENVIKNTNQLGEEKTENKKPKFDNDKKDKKPFKKDFKKESIESKIEPKNTQMKEKIKHAFSKPGHNAEKEKEVSLNEMTMMTKRDFSKKDSTKSPSQENKNSLKEALAAALGDKPVKAEERSHPKPEFKKPKFENKPKTQSQSKIQHKENKKSEVPESELRKVLGLD